jgi:hypothetical protein
MGTCGVLTLNKKLDQDPETRRPLSVGGLRYADPIRSQQDPDCPSTDGESLT